MLLRRLSLVNFKNYPDAEIEAFEGVNAFVGGNGAGKTNLLDAIHYLSICKSYFNSIDQQNIFRREDFFMIRGDFTLHGVEEKISCGLKRGNRKVVRRNDKEYERLSEHVGLLPVVMIAPTDSVLITGGSEERRKFTDSIISQFDRNYLDNLIRYAHVLMQRNAFLRLGRRPDEAMEIWNNQLENHSHVIHHARVVFMSTFLPVFKHYYSYITGGSEEVEIVYHSQLNEKKFSLLLSDSLEKDMQVQHTTAGPHKDDLVFLINGMPVKRFASQGQQKSFLIALKLAQFELISMKKGVKPILLLDDIFEKLDDERVGRLMELVSNDNFGQIFITDTHQQRLSDIFGKINVPIHTITVHGGKITDLPDKNPLPA